MGAWKTKTAYPRTPTEYVHVLPAERVVRDMSIARILNPSPHDIPVYQGPSTPKPVWGTFAAQQDQAENALLDADFLTASDIENMELFAKLDEEHYQMQQDAMNKYEAQQAGEDDGDAENDEAYEAAFEADIDIKRVKDDDEYSDYDVFNQ